MKKPKKNSVLKQPQLKIMTLMNILLIMNLKIMIQVISNKILVMFLPIRKSRELKNQKNIKSLIY